MILKLKSSFLKKDLIIKSKSFVLNFKSLKKNSKKNFINWI